MSDSEVPGSEPLAPRAERFAQILAAAARDGVKMTQLEAYCLSDPSDVKPKPTKGRKTNGSKLYAVAADRIAYLKRMHARGEAPAVNISAARLSSLMAEVTQNLLDASDRASDHGAQDLARRLRASAVTHIGRAQRVERRTGIAPSEVDTKDPAERFRGLRLCTCDDD
jgi:hypothetical protein